MKKLLCSLAIIASLCSLSGCDWLDWGRADFEEMGNEELDDDGAKKEIRALAAATRMAEDPDAEVDYEEAKQALIKRGSAVQSLLIENLASNENWGVRWGVVNVLQAIGTKRMVPALIEALADDHPRVAFDAMFTLRIVCNHREVPEDGEPVGSNGLPEIPQPSTGFDPDASQRLWAEWHAQNGIRHRDAWKNWWASNKNKVTIE